MMIKRRSLYFFVVILAILFVLLIYLIINRQIQQSAIYDEEIPEHLKAPLPDYPMREFLNYEKVGKLGGVHEHADIAIYVNGQQFDLSQLRYQLRDKFVHVEERRGDVIHKHAIGVTIGYFLSTLGFKFEDNCLVLDDGQELCNDNTNKLKVYVNGKLIDNYKDYEFFDLDRILVTYGTEDEEQIQQQLASITDNGRVFSKKE